MTIGSVEFLDDLFKRWKKVALYGYGAVGSWIHSYGIRFHKNITFILIDDFKQDSRFITLESFDGLVDGVIICNTRHQTRCQMLERLNAKFEKLSAFITNSYFEYELCKVAHYRPPKECIDKWNLNIFEPNDYLDAIKSGLYVDTEIDYYFRKIFANSYSYNDIKVDAGDVVCDGGAMFYDVTDDFIGESLKLGASKVIAFEPCIENYKKIQDTYNRNSSVKLFNMALGEKDGKLYFDNKLGANASCRLSGGGDEVSSVAIDSVFLKEGLDFLKLDIEGFEMEALKGAAESIKKYKPKLAICLYHKPNDPYDIPTFIKSLVPEYKMWIVSNEGQYWIGTKLFAKVD